MLPLVFKSKKKKASEMRLEIKKQTFHQWALHLRVRLRGWSATMNEMGVSILFLNPVLFACLDGNLNKGKSHDRAREKS